MVEKLRELTRAATPGPWVDGAGDIFAEDTLGEDGMVRDGECEVASCYSRNRIEDEALIVAMRNALPALLDVVEAARAVEESESVGQPSVYPRALKRLRDAIGRVEG